MSRESNLILDVGIGQFFKVDGTPFTLSEWNGMKRQEEDENIIESTDMETILQEAEEFLEASTSASEILKD